MCDEAENVIPMQAVVKHASDLWPTKDPCARPEWDFRVAWKNRDDRKYPFGFLPPEEVWLCHRYEFHRTLQREVTDTLEWRMKKWSPELEKWVWPRMRYQEAVEKWKTCHRRTFDALMEHWKRPPGLGRVADPITMESFYMVWPQWPEYPYLSIKPKEREDQFGKMWPNRKPLALRTLPLDKLCKAQHDMRGCGSEVQVALHHWPGERRVFDGETIVIYRKDHWDGKEYPHVVAALQIDFSVSPTRLAKRFENWCREQARKKGWKAKPNQGPSSEAERFRKELKYLGAWRLVQSGLTHKQAAEFTKECSGQPLFADKSEWSRAVKRGEALLFYYS